MKRLQTDAHPHPVDVVLIALVSEAVYLHYRRLSERRCSVVLRFFIPATLR